LKKYLGGFFLGTIGCRETVPYIGWLITRDRQRCRIAGDLPHLIQQSRRVGGFSEHRPQCGNLFLFREQLACESLFYVFGIPPNGTSAKGWQIKNSVASPGDAAAPFVIIDSQTRKLAKL
jgi:hypothetical protein